LLLRSNPKLRLKYPPFIAKFIGPFYALGFEDTMEDDTMEDDVSVTVPMSNLDHAARTENLDYAARTENLDYAARTEVQLRSRMKPEGCENSAVG